LRTKVVWDNPKSFGPMRRAQMALIREGQILEREIKMSMVNQGGGRVYKVSKTGPFHHASAPGEPPAVLTGRLRASITTCWTEGIRPLPDPCPENKDASSEDAVGVPGGSFQDFKVVVGTNVFYGPFLELGTSRMSPRPFIRPIVEIHRVDIERRIGTIVASIPMQQAIEMQQEIGGEFGTD